MQGAAATPLECAFAGGDIENRGHDAPLTDAWGWPCPIQHRHTTPHKTCTESGESNNSTIIHPRTATNRYIYIFCRLLGSRGLVSRCSSWKNETHNTTHIRVGGGQAEACHLAAAPRWWWWSLTVLCRSCRACAAGAEPVYRRTGMRDYCRGWVTVVIAWRHRSLFLNQSFGSSLSCRPSTCASVVCSPSKFRSRLILY